MLEATGRMRRAPLAIALLSLAACGARTGLSLPDASLPDASAACRTVTPDPRESAGGALCRFDGTSPRADAITLAAIEGDALYGVDGRGAVRRLYRFGEALPYARSSPARSVIVARGDYVAAALAWVELPVTRGSRVTVERVLARRDGAVLYGARDTLPYDPSGGDLRVRGNACGVFAWGWQFGSRRQMVVATAEGARVGPTDAYLPYGDPDDDGVLAAITPAPGSERIGWFDLRTTSFTPARYEAERLRTGVVAMGSDLAYGTAGSVTLERPRGAVERFESEWLRGLDVTSIAASSPDGWVLARGRGADHVAVNVRSGGRRHLVFALPDGLRRVTTPGFDPGPGDLTGVSITGEGELLLGLRDASLGRMHRSRDGSSWAGLEPPFGQASAVSAVERNGTVIAWTTGLGFLRSDWAPAPPGVTRYDGRNVFASRGAGQRLAPAALDWRGERHHLSSDGGCVSYWTERGLATVRVAGGAPREFVLSSTPVGDVLRQSRAMTWALGDDVAVPNVSD